MSVTVTASVRERTTTTVGVDLTVTDDGTAGLQLIETLDRFGILVHQELFECQLSATVQVPPIPMVRLPLRVRATDCADTINEPVPLHSIPPGTPGPGIPVPCSPEVCTDNSPCMVAVDAAVRARSRLVDSCTRARRVREERDEVRRLSTGLFLLAYGLLAMAAVVGAVWFLVGFAIMLAAIGAAALAGALVSQRRANELDAEFQTLRAAFLSDLAAFRAAVGNVSSLCCPQCVFVDISEPACDV